MRVIGKVMKEAMTGARQCDEPEKLASFFSTREKRPFADLDARVSHVPCARIVPPRIVVMET
jgi:hypothetical protein